MAASYMTDAFKAFLPVRTRHCALLSHIVHAMQFTSSWLQEPDLVPILLRTFPGQPDMILCQFIMSIQNIRSERVYGPFVNVNLQAWIQGPGT